MDLQVTDIVNFETEDGGYPLHIMDLDGQRWVSAHQVGEALGTQEIRRLIHELKKQGELKEGKHLCSVTELNPQGPGNPRRLLLSWRGVIRVAMRSQGARARLFRDWAEEVLYEVMMKGYFASPEFITRVRRESFDAATKLVQRLSNARRDFSFVNKLIRYRQMGLTMKETAKLLDVTRHAVSSYEKLLVNCGYITKQSKPKNLPLAPSEN
ncbi:MAG: hypothetical protein DRG63_05455 [Deltaproteobacteria bacterium]|nr:MAG: hypothetical protein DRG63_05455 [Deltaproteobacteria bacterium]